MGTVANPEEYYKKYYTDLYSSAKQTELNANRDIADKQEQIAKDIYGKQITDTKIAYDDMQRENTIQKLINENEIAENMANMGLSNSGLNRTQMTAAQLSYANNRSAINRQRQADVDSIAQQLATEISTIKQNKLSADAKVESDFATQISSDVQSSVKDYYERAEKAQKEAAEASYIIKESGAPLTLPEGYSGTLRDAGITITYNHQYDADGKLFRDENDNPTNIGTTTYYDTKSGKKTTIPSTVNPYTLDNNAVATAQNKDLVAAGEEFGYFDNGYQPKGVDGNTKFKLYSQTEDQKFKFAHASRNVFEGINAKTGKSTGKYYTWAEEDNRYLELKKVYTNKAKGEFKWEVVG